MKLIHAIPAQFRGLNPLTTGVLLGAAVVRLAFLFQSSGDPFLSVRFVDEQGYHEWARAVAGGVVVGERSFFTTPLFAYFLALIYRLFGDDILVVRAVNILLGTATVGLVWGVARRYLPRTIAQLPAAIVAFSAAPVFYEALPEKTTFVLFLCALAFLGCTVALERRERAAVLAAGFLCGLASLAHATMVTLPAAAAICIAVDRIPGRRRLLLLGMLAAGFFVAVSPAAIHNAIASRDLVLIASNGGQNFYTGNHAGNQDGTYRPPPFALANLIHEERDFLLEAERRRGKAGLKPSEVSRFWYGEALREMAAHPGLSARRFGNRLLAVFNREDLPDSRLYTFYTNRYALLRAGLLPFWLVAAFGLVGFGLSLPKREFLFINLVTCGLTLFLVLYFVFGRYRLPVLIPLALYAAVTAGALWNTVASRSRNRAAVLAASLSAAALFCLAPLPGTARGTFPDRFNLAMAFYREGRLDEAERLFQQLLAERRGDPRLAMALGMLRSERGDAAGAIEPLQIAVQANPSDYASWLTLGEAYRRTGEYARAETSYLKVLALNPRDSQAARGLLQTYQNLGKAREAERLVRALQQRAGGAGDPRAP